MSDSGSACVEGRQGSSDRSLPSRASLSASEKQWKSGATPDVVVATGSRHDRNTRLNVEVVVSGELGHSSPQELTKYAEDDR